VTAWKGGLGHLLSAAAPVEVALALACLERGVLPTALGSWVVPPAGRSLNFAIGSPIPLSGAAAMVLSLGLRGQAHAFILGRKDT
jgi:3-oxoacyl-(acyl-carrier-protein) synthase